MQILKRGKPDRAHKTWLQGGLLASCMCFAPLVNAEFVFDTELDILNPTPADSIISVSSPDVATLRVTVDLKDNQPTTFGVVPKEGDQLWDFKHTLKLTVTYDRTFPFDSGDPASLLNDQLTSLDVTITGAAANLFSTDTFEVEKVPRGSVVSGMALPSGSQAAPEFYDGSDPVTDPDSVTFSLIFTGSPIFRGDEWTIGYQGGWFIGDEALALPYDLTITPHYVSNELVTPIPGAVWLLGSGLFGLLGLGRTWNRA